MRYRLRFNNLNQGDWTAHSFTDDTPPVIFGKGVMKGTATPTDIQWDSTFPNRSHALLATHPCTYAFGKTSDGRPLTLRSTDQSDANNAALRTLISQAVAALRNGLIEINHPWEIRMPFFNNATLTRYQAGGTLPPHQDNEPEHINDMIISISWEGRAVMNFPRFKGDPCPDAIRLEDGDLLAFDRFLYHGICDVEESRTNATLRTWKEPWCQPKKRRPQIHSPSTTKRSRQLVKYNDPRLTN